MWLSGCQRAQNTYAQISLITIPRHYQLPVPIDLFNTLKDGTFFAESDPGDAYLQVEAAEESRELPTIITHRGLF